MRQRPGHSIYVLRIFVLLIVLACPSIQRIACAQSDHTSIVAVRNGKEYRLSDYTSEASETLRDLGTSAILDASQFIRTARRAFWLDVNSDALNDLYSLHGIVVSETEAREYFLDNLNPGLLEESRNRLESLADALEEVVVHAKSPVEVYNASPDLADFIGSSTDWVKYIDKHGSIEDVETLRNRVPLSPEDEFQKGKIMYMAECRRAKLRNLLFGVVEATDSEVEAYRSKYPEAAADLTSTQIQDVVTVGLREELLSARIEQSARTGLEIFDNRFSWPEY